MSLAEASLCSRSPAFSSLQQNSHFDHCVFFVISLVLCAVLPVRCSGKQQIGTTVTLALYRMASYSGDLRGDCGVCLERKRDGQHVTVIGTCNHSFHRACLDLWLETGSRTCPFCRSEVTYEGAELEHFRLASSLAMVKFFMARDAAECQQRSVDSVRRKLMF